MADLKTNYKDDVLDTSKNEKRKFRMIQNDDGTVSFDDATEYTQQGDAFGAADINATNAKINEQNQSLTYITSQDVVVGTLNGKDLHRRTYNLVKTDNLQSVIIDTSIKAGDVDYVLNIYGTFRNSLGNWYSLSPQSSSRVEVLLSYKGVELVINNIPVNKMIAVIEYTLV